MTTLLVVVFALSLTVEPPRRVLVRVGRFLPVDIPALTPETGHVVQICVASLLLFLGYRVNWTHSVSVDWLLTLIWILALTNAFDLLSRVRGLRVVVAAIAGAALVASPAVAGDQARIIACVVLTPLCAMLIPYADRLAGPNRLSERSAVALLSLLGAAGGIVAIALARSERWWSIGAMAAIGAAALAIHATGLRLSEAFNAGQVGCISGATAGIDVEKDGRAGQVLLDGAIVTLVYYAAYRLTFDSVAGFAGRFASLERSLPILLATQVLAFLSAGVYRGAAEGSRSSDVAILKAIAIAMVATAFIVRGLLGVERFPFNVLIIYGAFAMLATVGSHAALASIADRARRVTPAVASWARELAAVSAIFIGVSLFSAHLQTFTPRPFADAEEYLDMTRQFRAGAHSVSASAPWVYRVATPWMASFGTESQIASAAPFYLINITSAFVITVLLLIWLRRFVSITSVRLLLVTMFLIEWVAPARFVYFTPVYVDPLFIAFLLGGLLLVDASRLQPPHRIAPWLAGVVFLGTLSRESMGIVALAFIGCHNPWTAGRQWRWRDAVSVVIPLAAAVAALALVRQFAFPSEEYSSLDQLVTVMRQKPIFTWVLSWFFTFGPGAISLIAVDARRALEFLRRRPDLLVYLAACGVLSYAGGVDTERITLWAMPVIYVLVGRSIEQHHRTLRSGALVAALAATQIVSARMFWPVPPHGFSVGEFTNRSPLARIYEAVNRLVVIDTHYGNLWSYWGSRRWHAVLLVYDVALVGVLVVWMRSRRRLE